MDKWSGGLADVNLEVKPSAAKCYFIQSCLNVGAFFYYSVYNVTNKSFGKQFVISTSILNEDVAVA